LNIEQGKSNYEVFIFSLRYSLFLVRYSAVLFLVSLTSNYFSIFEMPSKWKQYDSSVNIQKSLVLKAIIPDRINHGGIMEKRAIIILTFLAGWLILGSLIVEITPHPVFAQAEQDPVWAPVERIGLMPFIKGRYGAEIDESLSCTVCLLLNDPKDLAPDSDFILTQYTQKALQKRLGEKVITLEQSEETYERIPRDDSEDSPRSLAKKLGEALNADLMIVGNVWKFRDRVGGSRAISEPASVAFAIYIIEVTSGKLLWKEVFSETQRPLSENTLNARAFFERGSKWLSANELASHGVTEIFQKFPY
jgi:hypothetical protein